ncbi:hypothetical protein [Gemmata sp.]|uniref:hypothetical protein n=1 Tax=Gemmata sp. TaxID=1914242 RepID=UPI003F713FDF
MTPKPHRLAAECLEPRETPATFTVTTTADSGAGSLRDAITRANASPGADTIAFAIPVSDPGFADANQNGGFDPGDYWSIAPTAPLPAITNTVLIDGWSQPGLPGNPRPVIELNGTSAGAGADGLALTDHVGSTVRGLAVNRFAGTGIVLTWGGGHRLVGDFVGTDPSGSQARPNGTGIVFTGSSANTVGGTLPKQRNVISGNTVQGLRLTDAVGTTVVGNLVGTSVTGGTAIPNGSVLADGDGIRIEGGGFNVVGGTTAAQRNVLSGNFDDGIDIRDQSVGNQVLGNFIGVKAGGRAALGNGADGVYVENASFNLIGGAGAGAANVLGANGFNGVFLYGDSNSNTIEGNFIGTNARGDRLGNGTVASFADGIFLGQFDGAVGPTGNTVRANTIAFNLDSAISVDIDPAATTAGNTFTRNAVSGNAGIAIDFASTGAPTPNDAGDPDAGPNRLQNFPVLLAPVANGDGTRTARGTLNSVPNTTFRIESFASGAAGSARKFLGAVTATTDAGGNAPPFELRFAALPPAMRFVTATATNLATGDTSQLSPAVT